jgi:hypothetical protein
MSSQGRYLSDGEHHHDACPLASFKGLLRHRRTHDRPSRIEHSALAGGEGAVVRIPLSARAMALLERRGHLRATIETVIRANGRIIAERARTVALVASGATG